MGAVKLPGRRSEALATAERREAKNKKAEAKPRLFFVCVRTRNAQPIASVFLMFGSGSAVRLPLLFLLLFCPGLLEAVRVYVNPEQPFLNRQHE